MTGSGRTTVYSPTTNIHFMVHGVPMSGPEDDGFLAHAMQQLHAGSTVKPTGIRFLKSQPLRALSKSNGAEFAIIVSFPEGSMENFSGPYKGRRKDGLIKANIRIFIKMVLFTQCGKCQGFGYILRYCKSELPNS